MKGNHRNSEVRKTEEDYMVTDGSSKDNYESNKSTIDDFIDYKDWKARKNIYSSIILKLETQPISEILHNQIHSKTDDKLINYLPKILEDNLPQSLEIGLDAVIQIIQKDHLEKFLISEEIKLEILKNIIEKTMLISKTSCKEKAKEIVFLMFELNSHLIHSFFKFFVKIFESNKPKAILTAQQIFKDVISTFGCSQFDLDIIFPILNKLLENTNSGVRSEAVNIYKEIYLFKGKDLMGHIKFSKEALKKEIQSAFKKIDDSGKLIPENIREIKHVNNINSQQHDDNKAKKYSTINDKNSEVKNLHENDKIQNNSDENESICMDFINKYKAFENSLNSESDPIPNQELHDDMENLYNNLQTFLNDNLDIEFLTENLFDKKTSFTFFNIINHILKIPLYDNKNLLLSLEIIEKTFCIINIFHNKQDEVIKEFYCIILENVLIKYIELEYLNNPNLYSRRSISKNSSFGNKTEEITKPQNSHRIDELKLNLKYSFLKMTYTIIENITLKKFLDLVPFTEEEKENFIYLKIDLLSKILENMPFLNIEENFKTLLIIFETNIDRNIKIDSIIYVCLKKLKNMFGNSFNEKLKATNDENLVEKINEFLTTNSNNNQGSFLKSNISNTDVKSISNQNLHIESDKKNEVAESKKNEKVDNEKNRNNNEDKKAFDDVISKKENKDLNVDLKKEEITPPETVDKLDKNEKRKENDDLIVIDMFDSKQVAKKNIPNKFKNLGIKNKTESKDEEKKKVEERTEIDEVKYQKKNIIVIDDVIVGKKSNAKIEEIKEKKEKIMNMDDSIVGPTKKNPKEEINETEKAENNGLDDDIVDSKKKKEKDLKDFEKMLEEQMLLESKRLEEKGIDIKSAGKKAPKNPSKSTNKKPPSNSDLNEEEKKNPNLKTSTSSNNLNTIENENLKAKPKVEKKPEVKAADKKPTLTVKPKDSKETQKEEEDDEKYSKMNKDEVENHINSFLGSETATLLDSEKWSDRKEGFVKIFEWIEMQKTNNNVDLIRQNFDNLFIYIKIKLKDFKENNFNLLREAFNIYNELIKLFAVKKIFDRKNCNGILKAYWEKLSEVKVKESLTNLIFTMMEYFTPNFILLFLIKQLDKTKSNALLKEYALLFEKTVEDFGIQNIPIKDLVEICKNMSSNSNPQTRNSSTSLLCVLYKYVGKDLKTLLKDIKEATFKLIEAELDKVEIVSNSNPAKRNIIADDAEEKKTGKAVNFSETLIPRVDIGKKITPKIIKDLNEGKWTDKKAAGETIDKILADANNKILPNGLNDLFLTVFKARLNDGNKNVVRLMIQLITKLIDALGNNFKSMPNGIFKNITPLLIANLADKMLLLREDAMICMEKWTQNGGIDNIIGHIPEQLKIDNFELRTDLFKFLHKHKEMLEKSPSAPQILKDFASPILKCLQDKVQQIRTNAEEFILFSLRFINISTYHTGLKDFKPAIQNDLKKILDNVQNNFLCTLNKANSGTGSEKENDINSTLQNLNNLGNISNNLNSHNNINNNDNNFSTINSTNAKIYNNNNFINLSTINNNDDLKQDSKISSKNVTNENLQSNSLIMSNKPNSKRSLNSNNNEKSLIKIAKDKDKSAERKIKPTGNENKTPEARIENNPYSERTDKNLKPRVSNFAGEKSKTPNIENQKTKNLNLSNINDNEKMNTINLEETGNINLSSNSMIINHNLKVESKTLGEGSTKMNNVGVSPRITKTTNKKKTGLQSWEIFQQNIFIKLSKEKRYELDKKNKFNLEAPSDEYINKLKENLNAIFIQEYVNKLLSDDIKNNVEALNLIVNYLEEYAQQTGYAIVEYLDIFLKWMIWKVNSNQNPSVVKGILEVFEILGEIFLQLDAGYKPNDIEIYIILNCLCEKLGNPNEKIREQARELIYEKYCKFIIPAVKSFSEIINLVSNQNKNSKIRLECIDLAINLSREYGLNIISIKDMKILIKVFSLAKSTDTLKLKLQDFIYNFLYQNSETYLTYLTDLDPKTRESLVQKINTWIKSQNINNSNNQINQNNLSNSMIRNATPSNNSNLTPRNNNETIKNTPNNIKKNFESINNKSEENLNLNTRSTAGPGQYTSRKEKPSNDNLNNTLNKKPGLSPNNFSKNYNSKNQSNEDLNNTTEKVLKSRNVANKIQNVNINISMEENPYNSGKNNGKNINNNQLINISNFENSMVNTSENMKKKTYSLEDKEDLLSILDHLNDGNDNEKVNTILIIHDIIHAKFDVSKHILIPNIDELINAFIIALKKLFENANTNLNEIPVKLGKYLITVLYKISSNKELIRNISYDVLFNLSEEVLSNLLIENLDKIGENQEGLVIIRSLNSTMLRVLENCDYTQVIEMLLDVVMKYRNSVEKNKISGLGIKCLLKIHQILDQIINNIKVDRLLLKIHLIFCEFERSNNGLESENQTDQMIIRFIKNFIYELVKIKKEEIIGHYRLIENHQIRDKYIKKWIKSILSSLGNDDISPNEIGNLHNFEKKQEYKGNKSEDELIILNNTKNNIKEKENLNKIRVSNIYDNSNKNKSASPIKKIGVQSYNVNSNTYKDVRINLDSNQLKNERNISNDKLIKNNSGSDMSTRLSNNNIDALLAYKKKLKEVKDKEMMNRSQIYESKFVTNLSSDEIECNQDINSTYNTKKDTKNFYNQINKIKKKWEDFSNNTRISQLNENHDMNRTTIHTNFDSNSDNRSDLNFSRITLNEVRNRWNQVSNNSNRTNMNQTVIESNNGNNIFDNQSNKNNQKRKSITK